MTNHERIMQELITELEAEEIRTGKKFVDMNLPKRPIEARFLEDLMTIFCRLDLEHQERACMALNNVLADQMAEVKAVSKAI